LTQQSLEEMKRVLAGRQCALLDLVPASDRDVPAAGCNDDTGRDPEKRITRKRFPPLHAFQQERELVLSEFLERGNRSFHVGKDLTVDGNEVPMSTHLFELGIGWHERC
jgi:hypothetical protein